MLLAFWELVLEQPEGGIFAEMKRPKIVSRVSRCVGLVQGLLSVCVSSISFLCLPSEHRVNRGQWGNRKSRAPPGRPRAEEAGGWRALASERCQFRKVTGPVSSGAVG